MLNVEDYRRKTLKRVGVFLGCIYFVILALPVFLYLGGVLLLHWAAIVYLSGGLLIVEFVLRTPVYLIAFIRNRPPRSKKWMSERLWDALKPMVGTIKNTVREIIADVLS